MTDQQGMALVTALLYLFVITLLVACAFSSSLLQMKISTHFGQEIQAFQYAERALFEGEMRINTNKATGDGKVGVNGSYQFDRQKNSQCGLFYQVDAMGIAGGFQSHLQSVFVFPQEGEKPCKDASLKPRRMVWRQINE